MDELNRLTPAALAHYVASVDLPRLQREGCDDTEVIFRYGASVGSVIHVYPSLERAMDTARQLISSHERSARPVANGTLILAATLTLSKGRFARDWYAPPGGLWGCLLLADTFLAPFRNFLPLILGIACCEAVQQTGAPGASLRWVNDVLLQGKKQAGFLIEGFRSPLHGEHYHLLGFGINLNNHSFPSDLKESAISLSEVLGHPVDICSFGLSFVAKLRYYIGLLLSEEQQWLARGGRGNYDELHPILKRWQELSDTIGRRVLFGYDVMENPQYEAVVRGIENDGALVLQHGDGTTSVEHSGELRYCR